MYYALILGDCFLVYALVIFVLTTTVAVSSSNLFVGNFARVGLQTTQLPKANTLIPSSF